jgi:hypothetical protein
MHKLMTLGSLFAFAASVLGAQPTRNVAPLKNWPAPLYWQPSAEEHRAGVARKGGFSEAAAKPGPLDGTAVVPLIFVAMSPCRVVDTRNPNDTFGGPSLVGGQLPGRTFPIQSGNSPCPVPFTAQAYSFNITVIPPGPLGFLTAGPTPINMAPNITTLSSPGTVVANAAIVPAGTNGAVDVYVSDNTDATIDINGYYVPTGLVTANGNDTAVGQGALANEGADSKANTAVGNRALSSNSRGFGNVAIGGDALGNNTLGNGNTAVGYLALSGNLDGHENTATGYNALFENKSGYDNTATGRDALYHNDGVANTATGATALGDNTDGNYNTADGAGALYYNTTGAYNTALGVQALQNNLIGGHNIAIGFLAGFHVDGSYNINLGNQGFANDSNAIRIGDENQNRTFISGVRGVQTGLSNAVPVLIDGNWQLGTVNSSRRYKEDIQDMSEASSGLLRLRPVTFRYKKPYADGSKPLDYGLIAEEVEEVYPDLVVNDAEGQVQTVQYQKLTPMLLNEVQKQYRHAQQQDETIRLLQSELSRLKALLSNKSLLASNGSPKRREQSQHQVVYLRKYLRSTPPSCGGER